MANVIANSADWPLVIVESPFAGDMEANRVYAIRACVDCLHRQEVPFASHLFFPQVLDELKPEEREIGITAGYAMWFSAAKIVFYVDRGFSSGMKRALVRATERGFAIDYRTLELQRHELSRSAKKQHLGSAYRITGDEAEKILNELYPQLESPT